MVKKDALFNNWKRTFVLNNKCAVKQFQNGFIIKKYGSDERRIKFFDRETTYADMSVLVDRIYKEQFNIGDVLRNWYKGFT